MSDRRSRDGHRRKDGDRRRGGDSTVNSTGRPIQQTPIILDRRERSEPTILSKNDLHASPSNSYETPLGEDPSNDGAFARIDDAYACIPFMRKSNRFNSEAIMKVLSDHTGHFVVGILGKQGVGKSTILSYFTENPEHAFPTQPNNRFLYEGHKTEGIDMYVTSERVILLDTEPIQSWTVLERALRDGLLNTNNSLPPDLWLEMETLYQIIFMISVCNVLIIATDGPNIDMDILRLLHSAEMLKFHIPDFPLLINQQDLNYFPDIVFVCNKSSADDFTWEKCRELHILLRRYFDKTSMRIQGLVSLGNSVPYFEMDDIEEVNLFFLPDQKDEVIDKFDSVIQSLRDQVFAAPRRPGKKGQVSEKDWYRNTVKIFEIVRKSEYIQEYINVLCKIRDS